MIKLNDVCSIESITLTFFWFWWIFQGEGGRFYSIWFLISSLEFFLTVVLWYKLKVPGSDMK